MEEALSDLPGSLTADAVRAGVRTLLESQSWDTLTMKVVQAHLEEQLLPQHPPGTLKPIKKLLKEVVDEKNRQGALSETNRSFYMRCPRIKPCIVGDHGARSNVTVYNDAGLYMGSVTAEQPMCGRHPPPYYCGHEAELPRATNMQEALDMRENQKWRRICKGVLNF